jgi:Tol biopolymer transport system component
MKPNVLQTDGGGYLAFSDIAEHRSGRTAEGVGLVAAPGALAASLAVVAVAASFAVACKRSAATDRSPARDAVIIETVEQHVVPEAPALGNTSSSSVAQARFEPGPTAMRPLLSSAELGDVFSPSFAPGGRGLVFHAGRDRAALMRATLDDDDRPIVATLLRDGAANYHASVSPDGAWLAYDSDRDGIRAVYVAHIDASEPRKISGDGYAAVPRWSPDGRRLAFIKGEATRPRVWNVWVADLDTGMVSRVSHHNVGQAWGASWFPDGKRVAYSVEDTLVLARVDDGSARVLPVPRRGRLIRTPAVSPDGKRIVFQVYRDGVWLLDVSSGHMRRVLTDAAAEEFAWSPDGRRVVFHTKRNGAWSVWELQLDPASAS